MYSTATYAKKITKCQCNKFKSFKQRVRDKNLFIINIKIQDNILQHVDKRQSHYGCSPNSRPFGFNFTRIRVNLNPTTI